MTIETNTPLDPAIAAIIPGLPVFDPSTLTPQGVRESLRAALAARPAAALPAAVRVENTEVQGADGKLSARVYRTASAVSPTVVYFHGGGWVAGDLETVDRQAHWLAIETGTVVVSVDYRRPPEVQFPGAFSDAIAALLDVADRISEFGGDAARLGVAGESAGGNLAAAAAIAARDAGRKLAGQLLIYPVTDAVGHYADPAENARFPSRAENAQGYYLTLAAMQWFVGQYIADESQSADWRVSPLRAETLAGVAPAVVCTAWFDPLRDEGAAYAKALRRAGVSTRYHAGPGLIHGYFGLGEASELARLAAQRVRADFKALLAGH